MNNFENKDRIKCKCGGTFDKPGKMQQPDNTVQIQYRCNKCSGTYWMKEE